MHSALTFRISRNLVKNCELFGRFIFFVGVDFGKGRGCAPVCAGVSLARHSVRGNSSRICIRIVMWKGEGGGGVRRREGESRWGPRWIFSFVFRFAAPLCNRSRRCYSNWRASSCITLKFAKRIRTSMRNKCCLKKLAKNYLHFFKV